MEQHCNFYLSLYMYISAYKKLTWNSSTLKYLELPVKQTKNFQQACVGFPIMNSRNTGFEHKYVLGLAGNIRSS